MTHALFGSCSQRAGTPQCFQGPVATQGPARHPVTKFLANLFIINTGKERKFSYPRFWLQLWDLLGSERN